MENLVLEKMHKIVVALFGANHLSLFGAVYVKPNKGTTT